MRSGEKGGIGFVVGFVSLAIRLLAVPELSDRFPVRIQNGHPARQIRNIEFVLVLVETARIADVSLESSFVRQVQIKNLYAVVVPVSDIDLGLALQRVHPN